MGSSQQQSGIASPRRSADAVQGGSFLTGGLFCLFSVELFLIGLVVWSFLVNRYSYPGTSADVTQWAWGLISLAAAGWGTWFLILSWRELKRWRVIQSRNLLAIMVASGALLLGLLLLNVANVMTGGITYMDVRDQFAVVESNGEAEESLGVVGNAEDGRKWFGMSCVTCHGATGEGVANAAPSLRSSEFLASADANSIASLIRNGRAANDPANKTGKVMPAKGGNPFLDETKISDLVAFLQDLDTQLGGAGSSAGMSVDLKALPSSSPSKTPQVVRNWKLEDLEGIEITLDEQSVTTGMQAFVKATCNKCHMAAVAGRELGPTLDQIVKRYSTQELLKHIVDPSAEINEQFQSHTYLLMDGRTVSGVIVSETDEEIELMTDLLKPDEPIKFLVDDVDDQVKSKVSAMPEGLLDVLTQDEIEGLVAYVSVSGKQLAEASAPQLGRWVVPEVEREAMSSELVASVSRPLQSLHERSADGLSQRYAGTFTVLFVVSTSVLALHFLWVVACGAAIVLHKELQLSGPMQMRLAQHTYLFWAIGLVWLVLWFLLFFLVK